MDRNEREARGYEDAAKEHRRNGDDRRAANMQGHADYLRDEVERGTPVYRPVSSR